MAGTATPDEEEEFHRLGHEHVDCILATPAKDMFVIKKNRAPDSNQGGDLPECHLLGLR